MESLSVNNAPSASAQGAAAPVASDKSDAFQSLLDQQQAQTQPVAVTQSPLKPLGKGSSPANPPAPKNPANQSGTPAAASQTTASAATKDGRTKASRAVDHDPRVPVSPQPEPPVPYPGGAQPSPAAAGTPPTAESSGSPIDALVQPEVSSQTNASAPPGLPTGAAPEEGTANPFAAGLGKWIGGHFEASASTGISGAAAAGPATQSSTSGDEQDLAVATERALDQAATRLSALDGTLAGPLSAHSQVPVTPDATSTLAGLALQAAPPATNSMAQSVVSAPVGSSQFATETAAKILYFVQNNVQSAQLSLNPDHLGPLTVQIRVSGEQVSLALGASQADTRHAIEAGLPKLREMFSEQGIQLGDLSVGARAFSQTAGGQQQSRGGYGSAPQDSGAGADAGNPIDSVPATSRSLQLVDTFA